MSQAFHGGRQREAQERFGTAVRLDFSVNTNAFWAPPALPGAVALSAAVARYPEADGASVAARLGALYGVNEAQLLPTAGAIEGLYLAARLFSGKRALLLDPCFADYRRACVAASVSTTGIQQLGKDTASLLNADTLAAVDVVVLGHPNNPCGNRITGLKEVICDPRFSHIAWIVDEAFIECVADHESASLLGSLEQHPNVLLLRAQTKSWAVPGLRLGFVATANEAWMENMRAMQAPWSLSGVAEAWALRNLTPENHASMLASLRPLPAIRRALSESLETLPGLHPYPSDANFLLVQTRNASAAQLEEALGRDGILIRVCRGFEGLDEQSHFRVAVRTESENAQLLDGLRRALGVPAAVRPVAKKRRMKAISVLGTSSNSGKSWMATALCAWLRRKGLRVAPFKAQNMSNNSAVTPDGGEIGRAQAVQAEACGLAPSVRMNPILLKPSGKSGSQLVRLGRAEGHIHAADYYKLIETLWPSVTESLAYWETRCDALVLEGAGSPVEMNLLQRDLVNLRPVHHLDGRWLLVADIERGGVFAQAAGTWTLLEPRDRERCCGLVVNKFRGDLSLFADAERYFAPHFGAPFLGTLPYCAQLQPENEDSLSEEPGARDSGEPLHWIRFPHLSNGQDTNPWHLDEGVRVEWVERVQQLDGARVIVLPGSKNTLADLAWLRQTGLAEHILRAHSRGALIIGICGGYQMLGRRVVDETGVAGERGDCEGLGLLPVETWFAAEKEVRTVEAHFGGESWEAYEIHMGRSRNLAPAENLLTVAEGRERRGEGLRHGRVWGTYLHGLFESSSLRREVAQLAGLASHKTAATGFREQRKALYSGMADLIEEHLNLEALWRYVAD
jgi:adenosylcobyric acid synthase